MTSQQFEAMKAQLSQLSVQQLRALRGEINTKLDVKPQALVSDDELKMIASLFS